MFIFTGILQANFKYMLFFYYKFIRKKIASFTKTKISLKFPILKILYNFALQYGISKHAKRG